MKKISFTRIVTLTALLLSAQTVIAFENDTLQTLQIRKPALDSNARPISDLFVPRLNNIPVTETTILPEGYTLNRDGSLAMPDDVRLETNGSITLPDNEYPESYTVESDGSVTAPKGVRLENKNKVVPEKYEPVAETAEDKEKDEKHGNNKPRVRSIATILGGLEEQYKGEATPAAPAPTMGAKPEGKPGKAATADKAGKDPKAQEAKGPDKNTKDDKNARERNRKDADKEKGKAKQGILTIPKDAAKTKDLAFLSGCWRTNMHKTSVTNGRDVYERFCFDRRGRGQIYVHESRGVFKGPATAQMEGNSLKIRSGRAYKSGIDGYYYGSLFICDGYENNTKCREKSENDHYWNLILTRVH